MPFHTLSLHSFRAMVLLVFAFAGVACRAADTKYLAFVGTYTGKGSLGIYAYRFDSLTGELKSAGLAAEAENPSFLVADSTGRFLYAVNETGTFKEAASSSAVSSSSAAVSSSFTAASAPPANEAKTGAVSAFAIDRKTATLKLLQQVASLGAGPAHISIDKSGRYVLVANYDGGNLAVFPILESGNLGPHSAFQQEAGSSINRERQEGPHAHEILTSNDNRFALSADLGTDQLLVYRFDAGSGSLTPNRPAFASVKAGSGPRHFAFAPSGEFVYLANEMASTVTVFSFNQSLGVLREQQTISTLPETFKGLNEVAEVAIDSKGRTLYVSNRGDDSIAVFRIDAKDGSLSLEQRVASGGKAPRHFALDPTGKWLLAANQESNSMQTFRVDAKNGRLSPVSQVHSIVAPVCIIFVPAE